MDKLENKQDIKMIIMKPEVYTVCDIGGDMYRSKLEISFIPGDCYPDYMQVERWLAENIDGKRLNIEDVVAKVYEFIEHEYHPEQMEVRNEVTNCRTHFDVTVIK